MRDNYIVTLDAFYANQHKSRLNERNMLFTLCREKKLITEFQKHTYVHITFRCFLRLRGGRILEAQCST